MTKRLLSSSPRLFSVDSANRTLPLVSAIVADLAPLWEAVNGMRNRIEYLSENRDVDGWGRNEEMPGRPALKSLWVI